MCEVETDCSTGSITNIFSCIDIGGGDDGGDDGGNNGGGEDPCYYDCYGGGGYPPYEEPPYEDPEDCNGTPGGSAYWSGCGCIGGTTGIGSCPEPEPEPNNPPQENEVSYLDIISLSVAHGSVYPELIDIADKARLGTLKTDWNSVVNATIDRNVIQSLASDLKSASQLNGVGILSATGKILGVAGAINSIYDARNEWSTTGTVSLSTVADVGISVGSLFIKSNIVGFGVSAGWLIIKETW